MLYLKKITFYVDFDLVHVLIRFLSALRATLTAMDQVHQSMIRWYRSFKRMILVPCNNLNVRIIILIYLSNIKIN